jgi:hypothetical protein
VIRRRRGGAADAIRGRLLGGPLPPSGKVVELEAYEAGRWRIFETVRAHRGARFYTRYHFVRAGGGHTIPFRARVRRDDSYPYYLGYSRRVNVRIG